MQNKPAEDLMESKGTKTGSPGAVFRQIRFGPARRLLLRFRRIGGRRAARPASRGQVTVELILMLVVAAVLMQVSWNKIKTEGYLDAFVTLPNEALGNMMSNGNWILEKDASKNHHPNRYGKRWSITPE